MPTFQRTETIDARQFTGVDNNGNDLVLWVNSNKGRAWWEESCRVTKDTFIQAIELYVGNEYKHVFIGDWIVLKEDGTFTVIRNEVFLMIGYKQV